MRHLKLFENFDNGIIGKEVNLKRSFVNVHSSEEPRDINGIVEEVIEDMMLRITDDGKTVANVMYDKNSGEFIEGLSTWKYVYEPLDEETMVVLDELKNMPFYTR
jgi:hypothetical protein